jgi:hypothetical protein
MSSERDCAECGRAFVGEGMTSCCAACAALDKLGYSPPPCPQCEGKLRGMTGACFCCSKCDAIYPLARIHAYAAGLRMLDAAEKHPR